MEEHGWRASELPVLACLLVDLLRARARRACGAVPFPVASEAEHSVKRDKVQCASHSPSRLCLFVTPAQATNHVCEPAANERLHDPSSYGRSRGIQPHHILMATHTSGRSAVKCQRTNQPCMMHAYMHAQNHPFPTLRPGQNSQ